jgi:hypothetical protein
VMERPFSPLAVNTVEPDEYQTSIFSGLIGYKKLIVSASCGEPGNTILRNPGRPYHFDSPETALKHARTAKWIEKNVVELLNNGPISTRTRR